MNASRHRPYLHSVVFHVQRRTGRESLVCCEDEVGTITAARRVARETRQAGYHATIVKESRVRCVVR